MTVRELIEYLRECEPSDRVLIATSKKSYIGAIPGVNVAHIYNGFDWDLGKVYLFGNLDLQVVPGQKKEEANVNK